MPTRQRPGWMDWVFRSGVERRLQDLNTWAYRRTGGKIGGRLAGAPVCLLTTIGRKSSQARTLPLLFLADGETVVLVASRGGTDTAPLWYRNLCANPDIEIQIGPSVRPMRARTATDDEKAYYWPKLVANYRGYAAYQTWTDRVIPVVICTPR